MAEPNAILFTAFEPSGDALAAPVIERLRQMRPELTIWALGGPRMHAAGAQLIETTTEHAVMLAGALAHANAHRARLGRLRGWLADHPIAMHVPVDSPAANWSVCKLVRRAYPEAAIAHLAAPQLWAWAPWRIKKLRRLTDRVLCLLPFEPDWFTERGVAAEFVGHPIFDPPADLLAEANATARLPHGGHPKVLLMPGSRTGEITSNWPTMLRAFLQVQRRHPLMRGLVLAHDERAAGLIRRITSDPVHGTDWPRSLGIAHSHAGATIDWADFALVASGTATLQVAAHGKPMVVMYNIRPWVWHLWGRWVVKTKVFSLPNLIAQHNGDGLPVPEHVPHFGAVEPIAEDLERLISDHSWQQRQRAAFATIRSQYAGRGFQNTCAAAMLGMLDGDAEGTGEPGAVVAPGDLHD